MLENVNFSMEDARRIISEKYPDEVITTIIDYVDFYVIGTEFPNIKDYIKSPHAVEKKTGKIFTFNPLLYNETGGKILYRRKTEDSDIYIYI